MQTLLYGAPRHVIAATRHECWLLFYSKQNSWQQRPSTVSTTRHIKNCAGNMALTMSYDRAGAHTAFASSSSGPSYHASLRRDLQVEAGGYLSSLAQQIQV